MFMERGGEAMATERDREILEQLAGYGMEVAAALKAQIVASSDADVSVRAAASCADGRSI
jgi:hypothetical protein